MINKINWLYCRGQEGFVALPEWRGEMRRAGIKCTHCDGVRPDAIHRLDHLVVSKALPQIVLDTPSAFWGGLVIRADFAEVMGLDKLNNICCSVPVLSKNGKELKDFRFYMERKRRGSWRGSKELPVGLCKVCSRLLYWPGNDAYMLRRYWDGSDSVTFIDASVACTNAFAEKVVKSKKFITLLAESRRLEEQPEDGLPADHEEMIAEIKRQGLVR